MAFTYFGVWRLLFCLCLMSCPRDTPHPDVVKKMAISIGCLFYASLSLGKMGEGVRRWRAEETKVCASDHSFLCPSSEPCLHCFPEGPSHEPC